MSGITRGDVFYVESYQTEGSEQRSGRPAVIVSNDMCNEFSEVVEVVYLTTRPKQDLPTHVTIRSTQKTSIALCEQITSVSKSRLGDWTARISPEEMASMEIAMMVSLALEPNKNEPSIPVNPPVREPAPAAIAPASSENELILRTQRDTYKALYEDLLCKLVPVSGRSA